MSKPFIHTKEQHEFIRDNYKGISSKELAKIFNKKFNTERTGLHMQQYKSNHKLRSGYDAKFKPGHIPATKGKKWDDYMSKESQAKSSKTFFKRGDSPHNKVKIGTEIQNGDGYYMIKVAEPDEWVLKQRYVWERHYGELKKDEVILFLDQNRRNCDIDNLVKITKSELVRFNQNNLASSNPVITEAGVGVAKLLSKLGELEREN